MRLSTIKIIVDTRSLRSPEKLLEFSQGRLRYTLPALFPLEFQAIGQSVSGNSNYLYLFADKRKEAYSQQNNCNFSATTFCKSYISFFMQGLWQVLHSEADERVQTSGGSLIYY